MGKANTIHWVFVPFIILVLIYAVFKALLDGPDVDLYLTASRKLCLGENLYSDYIYVDNYLYSPFFALLMVPLTWLSDPFARVIWALLNLALTVRLWLLLRRLLTSGFNLKINYLHAWSIGILILSLGFLNHNLILGQITIVILWLTLEGLHLVFSGENLKGSALLALGINIKILPIIAVFYLFFKWKIRALIYIFLFSLSFLFLPALFFGLDYNTYLLGQWKNTINPVGERYNLERGIGCNSLNAILPAYFYDFGDEADNDFHGFKRKIASVSAEKLSWGLNITRVLLLCSVWLLVFHQTNQRKGREPIFFYWEFAYLMLVSYLIFPHQMKYAMLYFVPAGGYMWLYFLVLVKQKWKGSMAQIGTAVFSVFLLLLLSIMGRDLIGDYWVDLFGYYHVMGLICIIFLMFLLIVKPERLVALSGSFQKDHISHAPHCTSDRSSSTGHDESHLPNG